MSDDMDNPAPARTGSLVIASAALFIILLGVVAACLPLLRTLPGEEIVGWLLLLAGLAELVAGVSRGSGEARNSAILAGAVTALAGLLFVVNPLMTFIRVFYVVIGWLLIRALILMLAARRCHGRLRKAMAYAAASDAILFLILVVGLPVVTLISALFGPTPELVSSFALILAVSFLVTGMSLLAIARSGRPDSDDGDVEL